MSSSTAGVFTCSSCDCSVADCDSRAVCPKCGTVIAEEQAFSNYDSTSFDYSGSVANANGSHKYGHGFNQQQRTRLPTISMGSSVERKLKKMINLVCTKLKLSKEISEQTTRFVITELNGHPKFKFSPGKFRMVGSCIYIICRTNGIPITLKQIAVASGCSHFVLGDYVKQIDRVFNMFQTPISITSLITVACSHVENSKQCEDLAQHLYAQSSSAMLLTSQPLCQAIAHTVIAAVAVNKGTTQKQMVQNLCLKMSKTNDKAVISSISTLKNYMFKLLKEIPWVDVNYVKPTNVFYYLKDIMKYRQSIGEMDLNTKPEWYKLQEEKTVARKEKISNALDRIKVKKEQSLEEIGNNEFGESDVPVSMVPREEFGDFSSVDESTSADSAENLDEEDKIIEDLLEMGCSPQDVQEGFYDNLKIVANSSVDFEDQEIESYVRSPAEVNMMKKVPKEHAKVTKRVRKKLKMSEYAGE